MALSQIIGDIFKISLADALRTSVKQRDHENRNIILILKSYLRGADVKLHHIFPRYSEKTQHLGIYSDIFQDLKSYFMLRGVAVRLCDIFSRYSEKTQHIGIYSDIFRDQLLRTTLDYIGRYVTVLPADPKP